jgi:hypothetical protein
MHTHTQYLVQRTYSQFTSCSNNNFIRYTPSFIFFLLAQEKSLNTFSCNVSSVSFNLKQSFSLSLYFLILTLLKGSVAFFQSIMFLSLHLPGVSRNKVIHFAGISLNWCCVLSTSYPEVRGAACAKLVMRALITSIR